jgi:dolichyl-diphosphooligosaccharide--protein glycosyltransferase
MTRFATLAGRPWFRPLFFALLVYAATLAVRLSDLPKWDHDALRVDGEYIMATHDAYAWLAGAYGVGTGAGAPLARMARAYADITGRPAGEFAFFAPAFAASLVGVALLFWAWTLGGLEAGLGAGFLAALAPGFFYRTRLGYYDTDLATLLFPVLLGWAVAHWLDPHLRRPLDLARRRPESGQPEAPPSLAWPLATGLLARLGGADWHTQLPDFYFMVSAIAAGLVLFLARPASRPRLCWGLAVLALAGFCGDWGLAGALGVVLGLRLSPRLSSLALDRRWPGLAALALVLLLTGVDRNVLGRVAGKFAVYSKSQVEMAGEHANRSLSPALPAPAMSPAGPPPIYPGITQSVVEAQNIPMAETLAQVLPRAWLTWTGLAGFGLVVLLRPVAVFLLPLGILALLAHKLGVRLTMFGGPVAALGLVLPVVWALRRLPAGLPGRSWVPLLASVALAAAVMGPTVRDYVQAPPTPIFSKAHAVALKALARTAPPGSRVWTWWDWGYATQYYARRMTFADGARHSGEYLFPQALVLATPFPLQANQVIAYSALLEYRPWEEWNRRSGAEVNGFLGRIARERFAERPQERQYLVVAWDNLRLMYWISYYGSWDVAVGDGRHGICREIGGKFSVDEGQGLLRMEGGESIPLATLDVAGPAGRKRQEFPNQSRAHLVVNDSIRQAVVLDDLAYSSMMVQLLLANPDGVGLADTFRLVYEGFPLVRIYEVL